MKKLQIPICGNAELAIWVTEQMEKDFRECRKMTSEPAGEGKDCDTCSWWGKDIGNTGLCEIVEVGELLK